MACPLPPALLGCALGWLEARELAGWIFDACCGDDVGLAELLAPGPGWRVRLWRGWAPLREVLDRRSRGAGRAWLLRALGERWGRPAATSWSWGPLCVEAYRPGPRPPSFAFFNSLGRPYCAARERYVGVCFDACAFGESRVLLTFRAPVSECEAIRRAEAYLSQAADGAWLERVGLAARLSPSPVLPPSAGAPSGAPPSAEEAAGGEVKPGSPEVAPLPPPPSPAPDLAAALGLGPELGAAPEGDPADVGGPDDGDGVPVGAARDFVGEDGDEDGLEGPGETDRSATPDSALSDPEWEPPEELSPGLRERFIGDHVFLESAEPVCDTVLVLRCGS